MQRTRRRRLLPLVLLPALALLSGAPSATATDGHDPCVDAGGTAGRSPTVKGLLTCTFSTSGSYAFTVPAGVTSITVTAVGAKGGNHGTTRFGGNGAQASGTFAGLAGAALTVVVGHQGDPSGTSGAGGYPDGGAGGADAGSTARGAGGGGSSSVASAGGKIVIAGGGGGAGAASVFQAGLLPGSGAPAGLGQNATSGTGANGTSGGGGASDPLSATPDVGGLGGSGGQVTGTCSQQRFGTAGNSGTSTAGGAGAPSLFAGAGGGGGGGYAGGGGGGSGARCDNIYSAGGGGGGGSSLVAASATSPGVVQNGSAPGNGDGSVVIAYQLPNAKNLVKDGGFEKPVVNGDAQLINAGGTIGPWVVSGSVDLVGATYWQPAEGAQSVDLAGLEPGWITYSFTAPFSDDYKLTYKLAGNPDCAPVKKQLGVYWNGQLVDVETFSTRNTTRQAMGWKSKSVTVPSFPGPVSLQFVALNTGACGPVIDKVAVKYL